MLVSQKAKPTSACRYLGLRDVERVCRDFRPDDRCRKLGKIDGLRGHLLQVLQGIRS